MVFVCFLQLNFSVRLFAGYTMMSYRANSVNTLIFCRAVCLFGIVVSSDQLRGSCTALQGVEGQRRLLLCLGGNLPFLEPASGLLQDQQHCEGKDGFSEGFRSYTKGKTTQLRLILENTECQQ